MDESIPRATTVAAAGTWPEAEARDTVTVDFDDRFRRRRLYTAAGASPSCLTCRRRRCCATATGCCWRPAAMCA
jgi:hypothetical protein